MLLSIVTFVVIYVSLLGSISIRCHCFLSPKPATTIQRSELDKVSLPTNDWTKVETILRTYLPASTHLPLRVSRQLTTISKTSQSFVNTIPIRTAFWEQQQQQQDTFVKYKGTKSKSLRMVVISQNDENEQWYDQDAIENNDRYEQEPNTNEYKTRYYNTNSSGSGDNIPIATAERNFDYYAASTATSMVDSKTNNTKIGNILNDTNIHSATAATDNDDGDVIGSSATVRNTIVSYHYFKNCISNLLRHQEYLTITDFVNNNEIPTESFVQVIDDQQLENTITNIQQKQDQKQNNLEFVPINSLVFEYDSVDKKDNSARQKTTTKTLSYIVVIIPSNKFVNIAKLQDVVQKKKVRLVQSDLVHEHCGFQPGCVPPIGFMKKYQPTIVVIDDTIVHCNITSSSSSSSTTNLYVGGGGMVDQSLIISLTTLQSIYPDAIVGSVSQQRHQKHTNTLHTDNLLRGKDTMSVSNGIKGYSRRTGMTTNTITPSYGGNVYDERNTSQKIDTASNVFERQKPYFPFAPPSDDTIQQYLSSLEKNKEKETSLATTPASIFQPQLVSIVGRVGNVRRISKKLVFFDLFPSDTNTDSQNVLHTCVSEVNNNQNYPWRCPQTGIEMAVQVIGGKTLCDTLLNNNHDEDECVNAIKRISSGQLVWFEGRTNIGLTNTSLNNWLRKRSFDIVLHSYQILLESSSSVAIASDNVMNSLIENGEVSAAETKYEYLRPIYDKSLASTGSVSNIGNNFEAESTLRSVAETETGTSFVVNGVPYLRPTTESSVSSKYDLDQVESNWRTSNDRRRSNRSSVAARKNTNRVSNSGRSNRWEKDTYYQSTEPTISTNPEMFLAINDIYDSTTTSSLVDGKHAVVVVVNDIKTARLFESDLSMLMSKTVISEPIQRLIGIDCEWKPNFLFEQEDDSSNPNSVDPDRRQPVLLLQVSLHLLERVYLLDLQSLLRPFLYHDETMNEMESIISSSICTLYESQQLIKVGFQVDNDFQRLVISYPHIVGFQSSIENILDLSNLARKAFRILKLQIPAASKKGYSLSLSKLSYSVLGKYVDKEQQCSDWSTRPLSRDQIHYAALDAAVGCKLVESLLDMVACELRDSPVRIRYMDDVDENDSKNGEADNNDNRHFETMVMSTRYTFFQVTEDDQEMVNSMQKQQQRTRRSQSTNEPVDHAITCQSWISGSLAPEKPNSLVSVDLSKSQVIYKQPIGIPCKILSIRSDDVDTRVDAMLGDIVGKTKNNCVDALLQQQQEDSESIGRRLAKRTRYSFPERTGYIEFDDGVALFVNSPADRISNFGQSRSYPNEWLNDGQVLTWFLRNNEWDDGSSPLAKKLIQEGTSSGSAINDDTNVGLGNRKNVLLFVRMKRSRMYVCCGRVMVVPPWDKRPENHMSLIKLHLLLQDWNTLFTKSGFRQLIDIPYDD